ncbi:acyltransferase family protein [Planobispora longispora]|uniref:Acyltransferase 3 domain-containing protein n=1 Tax=Planobispora longispora TaxID=28887 RepID=A0A8J3W5J1_9ACTN|nr:acyltransferase [Planobispora longispora]GIH76625.1 hypothetical protein Plo01_30540 [Planobispora longispora]
MSVTATGATSRASSPDGRAPSAAAPARERVRWADTAKGVCILLVVLWHVVAKHYLRVDWRIDLPVAGAWGALGEQLLPLRMPLFFTISGMFALGAVNRPWRMTARSRVAKFLYLYALWLLIHTAILSTTPEFPTDRATGVAGLVEQLTITPSNLWYLYALALYFVIAKLTRRFPRLLVLGLALTLSVLASADLIAAPGNRAGLYQNLVFFLAGMHFRPAVERLAAAADRRRLLLTGGGYATALLVMAVLGAQAWPGVWPAVSVAATAFGVTAAVALSRWRLLSTPLAALGRQTLPIYVIHMPVLALLDLALAGPLSGLGGAGATAVAVVEPILLTALVTGICLALNRGLRAAGAVPFLLDLPGRGRAAGRHRDPAGRRSHDREAAQTAQHSRSSRSPRSPQSSEAAPSRRTPEPALPHRGSEPVLARRGPEPVLAHRGPATVPHGTGDATIPYRIPEPVLSRRSAVAPGLLADPPAHDVRP